MDKLAIVTPGVLPVPNIKGGAIEGLITIFINQNELHHYFDVDLYTVRSDYDSFKYKYTNLILIDEHITFSKLIKRLNSLLYSLCRRLLKVRSFAFLLPYDRSVVRKINSNKYEYVLVEGNHRVLNRIKNSKLVYHNHWNDVYPNMPLIDKNTFERKFKNIFSHISVSTYINNNVKAVIGDRINNYHTVGNIIDNGWIKNVNQNAILGIKEKYFLNNKIVFGYFGRISEEKGVLELVKAFKNVNNTNAALLICGGANYSSNFETDYFKDVIRQSKDNGRIHFTGYVDHSSLVNYMDLCDVVVIPTTNVEEASSLVFLESVICKKPLIVSDSGALNDYSNKDYVVMVNRGCSFIQSLSNTISRICNDDGYRNNLKVNAQKAAFDDNNDQDYFYHISEAIRGEHK